MVSRDAGKDLPRFKNVVAHLKLPHSSGGIGEAKGEKTAMRGYSLRSGLPILAILLLAGTARAESTGETLRFAVMRDGQQIGSTTIELHRNGPETTVQVATHIQVKLAFVTVYRFDQTETEHWRDGQLVALDSATDDNGTKHRVKATSGNNKITVTADGKVTEVAGTTIPASYWNPALLGRTTALDPQDGAIVPVAVVDRGEDHLIVQGRAKRTHHYVIRTTFPQDVWYDEDRQLVKVQLKGSDGSTISYQPG